MSTVQIHVHWREHIGDEPSSVFRGCTLLKNDDVLFRFAQGTLSRFVNIAATQLITVTTEKETA